MTITVGGTSITFNDATTISTQPVTSITNGGGLTVSSSTGAVTITNSNTGTVTSVSGTGGLTGTVTTSGSLSVDTSTYAIGQCSMGRPRNGTSYVVGNTVAGSSLYTGASSVVWNSAGAGAWSTAYGPPDTAPTLINTGTWKCISPCQIQTSCGISIGFMGMWVRIS